MKKLRPKEYFLLILLLAFGIFFIYDYFDNKTKIQHLTYGVKANALRSSLNIPKIDSYMIAQNKHDSFDNRWESFIQKPIQEEVLHVWKYVSPSEVEGFLLGQEKDAFRKRNNDGKIVQLNIYSTILGDSLSSRRGSVFFYDSKPRNQLELDETGIDSVSKSWGLDYLNKN